MADRPLQVAMIGAGAWGTAMSKVIAANAQRWPEFAKSVLLWVFEEVVDGRPLADIINSTHENVKYLPGVILPDNVQASSDLLAVTGQADILVIAVPHQFLHRICNQMKGHTKPGALALSLIKGLDINEEKRLELLSRVIGQILGLEVAVLMGANIASEVARGQFCESTLAARNPEHGRLLHRLLDSTSFRVAVVQDCAGVEICGALKNVVACAAGICDGLGMGSNTKAAVMRIGLLEMLKFADLFYEGVQASTILESCGVADLITTCNGGRNRRIAEAMVRTRQPLSVLEETLMQGQKVPGPLTAQTVFETLQAHRKEAEFPLFVAVHHCLAGALPPEQFLSQL